MTARYVGTGRLRMLEAIQSPIMDPDEAASSALSFRFYAIVRAHQTIVTSAVESISLPQRVLIGEDHLTRKI